MAKQIILTQNNFGIPIELQFMSNTNSPVDLTDKTVEVAISYDGTVIDVFQAAISSYTNGTAYIIVNTKHTSNVGLYTTFWSVRDKYGYITAQSDLYYYVKEEYNGAETPGIEQDKENLDISAIVTELETKINVNQSSISIINNNITNLTDRITTLENSGGSGGDINFSCNAEDVQFTDGENLQDKLDNGKLGSSNSGTGLTEEQANNIKKIPSIEGTVTSNSQAIANKADRNHEHTEYLTEIPDEYVTDTELSSKGYATETFVTNKIAEASLSGGDVDLSGYATVDALKLKADLTHTHDQYLTKVPSEYVTETEMNEAIANISSGGSGGGGSIPVELSEPYDDDIPRIFLSEGTLPTTKTSTTMKFEYISKNKRYSGYVDIKCQGTSSMSYPKKNFTIKTYNDKALADKMKINFMNWGKQNKFCLKANYIDISHARNIVSARLWGDIVKTRENYLELPELLRTSPNNGAIDGFFVKIYANGVYQGRYTMNIPKDKWMANMDDSLDEHCILCAENYESGLFRAIALINGNDWSDELHDIAPTSIVNRWNQVINFVMNSSDTEFKANIGQYFDLTSLIDYYIFAYVSCGLDSMGKNQIYMTYDGQKWIASMYDMDSTWGLYWNGQKFISASYRMQDDYESATNGRAKNLLYLRLEGLFINEIKERYAVLRNGALSETNIINRFEEFMICNNDLIKEDYEIFSNIPSQNTNNIKQIRKYVVDRCIYVDEQIDNLIIPVPCTGITLDKSSLTFTDNTPQTLQVTVEPEDTTDKISYSINPSDIARIDNGVVTPRKNGTATITVTCGTISKTCSVDITGIEEGADIGDYTALDLSSIQKGQPFTIYDGALDFDNQTLFADITLDDTSENQNILSIGLGINTWVGGNVTRIHCYYPKSLSGSTRQMEICINNNNNIERATVTITNNKLKMALNANGIYVNGTKVDFLYASQNAVNFASLVAQKTAQIGSLEGNNKSKATYNKISIYNKVLSQEEIITLNDI